MKVQFAPGSLRLRASRAELQALLASGSLVAALDWPGGSWLVRVSAAEAFDAEGDGSDLAIRLPRQEVESLSGRLPSRDGLRYALVGPWGTVEIRFEVDLHDGRGRPR